MIGVVATVLAVIGSGLVGFAVHRFLMSSKVSALFGPLPAAEAAVAGRGGPVRAIRLGLRRHLCTVIAIVAGLATGIGAYTALGIVGHLIPAVDNPDFFRAPVAAQVAGPDPALTIELVYNPASPIRRDFIVKVRVVRSPLGFGPGHYLAGLAGSRIVDIREDQTCPADAGLGADARRAVSCIEIAAGTGDLIFRWDVTPVESGQSNLSIRFAGDWMPPTVDPAMGSAMLRVNGTPFPLEPGHSEYEFGQVGLTLGDHAMRFPVEVETSLGLSQSTYDAIMLFVGLAGCVFGSGWLFRFIGQREKKAPA